MSRLVRVKTMTVARSVPGTKHQFNFRPDEELAFPADEAEMLVKANAARYLDAAPLATSENKSTDSSGSGSNKK